MDLREHFEDVEEAMRTVLDGFRKTLWTSMPVIVEEDSDGHTVKAKMAIKYRKLDPQTGEVTHEEFPVLQDIPIKFAQGGGVVLTHPVKKGDEGVIVFSSRPHDTWHQSGGVQQSIDTRLHSLSDAFYFPGHRSDPRKIPNNSTQSAQLRSDDGKHTVDHHPKNGTRIKTVDPSDSSSDPFNAARKFYESVFHPTNGVAHTAVNEAVTHLMHVAHELGALMSSTNGSHTVNTHPSIGVLAKSIQKIIHAAAGTVILNGGGSPGSAPTSAPTSAQDQAAKNVVKTKAQADLVSSGGRSVTAQTTLPSGASYTYTVNRA